MERFAYGAAVYAMRRVNGHYDEARARAIWNRKDDEPFLTVRLVDPERETPVAQIAIDLEYQNAATTWFNDDASPSRRYHFQAPDHNKTFFPDGAAVRENHWFVTDLQVWRYEVDRVTDEGFPYCDESCSRMFSTDGSTSLVHQIRGDMVQQRGRKERVFKDRLIPEGPLGHEWREDPAVDVSGEGFWERVPEFGDWERFLVQDRPGVKVVY